MCPCLSCPAPLCCVGVLCVVRPAGQLMEYLGVAQHGNRARHKAPTTHDTTELRQYTTNNVTTPRALCSGGTVVASPRVNHPLKPDYCRTCQLAWTVCQLGGSARRLASWPGGGGGLTLPGLLENARRPLGNCVHGGWPPPGRSPPHWTPARIAPRLAPRPATSLQLATFAGFHYV